MVIVLFCFPLFPEGSGAPKVASRSANTLAFERWNLVGYGALGTRVVTKIHVVKTPFVETPFVLS